MCGERPFVLSRHWCDSVDTDVVVRGTWPRVVVGTVRKIAQGDWEALDMDDKLIDVCRTRCEAGWAVWDFALDDASRVC